MGFLCIPRWLVVDFVIKWKKMFQQLEGGEDPKETRVKPIFEDAKVGLDVGVFLDM